MSSYLRGPFILLVVVGLCLSEDAFGQIEPAMGGFLVEENTLSWPNDIPKKIPVRAIRFGGQERFTEPILRNQINAEAPAWWKQQWAVAQAWSLYNFSQVLPHLINADLPRWDAKILTQQLQQLKSFLNAQGYEDAGVHAHVLPVANKVFWDIWFHISLGEPTTISSVEIRLVTAASELEDTEGLNWVRTQGVDVSAEAQIELREQGLGLLFIDQLSRAVRLKNSTYTELDMLREQNRLRTALREKGYVFAQVVMRSDLGKQVTRKGFTETKAKEIGFDIILGQRPIIQEILVDGKRTVPKKVVQRELTLKPGQYFSETEKRNSLTQLYTHPLFDRATIQISEQSDDEALTLQVQVKEEELRSFQWRGGLGYFDRLERSFRVLDSYQLFRTQWSWVHRNLGGGGQQFSTELKLSYFERYLEADYLFPYVFNTKSSVRIHPFMQYRDERAYNITSSGMGSAFSYVVNSRLTGTFSYRFARNDESNVEAGQGIPDSLLTYNLSVFNLSSRYHSQGIIGYNTFSVQPTIELSGLFGEGDFSYQRLLLDIRKYTPVGNKSVFASRVRGGWIFEQNRDSLPSDVRFYNGGSTLVRGWARHSLGPKEWVERVDSTSNGATSRYSFVPTGGKASLTLNLEWREQFEKWRGGYGVVFLDGGQVWANTESITIKDIQWALGAGIRYRAPIGPIRIDLAYKLNPSSEDLGIIPGLRGKQSWARWVLYVSIGEAF